MDGIDAVGLDRSGLNQLILVETSREIKAVQTKAFEENRE